MPNDLITSTSQSLTQGSLGFVPKLFAATGQQGIKKFFDFFTAEIDNPNTRAAYARAVRQFALWCEDRGLSLAQLSPTLVAAYLEWLGRHPDGQNLASSSVEKSFGRLFLKEPNRNTYQPRVPCGAIPQ